MRVSDSQRQRVIDELRRHCAAGRLDVDEYATRIEAALAASTLEDLDRVLGDLPMLRIADPAEFATARDADPAAGSRGRPGWANRMAARAVVLISVLVVVGAVVMATVASWAWAAVLLGGWVLGLTQAGVARRRH